MSDTVVTVEKVVAGGDALAHLDDGRVVFVTGALPGEVVRLELLGAKRDFARARVCEVVEASPLRVAPPCRFLTRGCGGCSWQHVSPSGQMALKVAIVAEALRRTGGLPDAVVEPFGAVGPWAYRTTMRLSTDRAGRVGLRAARSHRLVQLDDCMVAHPLLAELLGPLRVRNADEVSLRVGIASGERTAFAHSARGAVDGLPDDVGVGPHASLHEVVAGVRLRVSAESFFQSGPQAAELLVAAVGEACGPELTGGPLLDAYGGVGLFAATLGGECSIVVESSPAACADARVNLAGSDILVECAAVEEWAPQDVPLIVADPARGGLGAAGSERLAATHAQRIVLVSCDPVSLARDAALLTRLGYLHCGSRVLDLFPHTPHVEVVTRFDRQAPGSMSYGDPRG